MSYDLVNVDFSPIEPIRRRASIFKLEECLLAMAQASTPLQHFFANGLYARRLDIPKGCALTGAIHKHENIAILAQGDITIVTEEGIQRLIAPFVLVSKQGIKRAGFAHEDTVFITVHATNAKTPDAVWEELFTNSYRDYDQWLLEHQS